MKQTSGYQWGEGGEGNTRAGLGRTRVSAPQVTRAHCLLCGIYPVFCDNCKWTATFKDSAKNTYKIIYIYLHPAEYGVVPYYVFICISLMINDTEHVFLVLLAICISLERCCSNSLLI